MKKSYLVKFSDKQLFLIERIFDEVAHTAQRAFADSVHKLSHLKESKKKNELINRLLDECVEAYDMCRTISAICQGARECP